MIGRRQELNLQLNQMLDAALIALAFLVAYKVRVLLLPLIWPQLPPIPPFEQLFWVVAVASPFTPIFLESRGYYRHLLSKSLIQSVGQMVHALIAVSVIIGACVVFFRWPVGSRIVFLLAIPLAALFLLAKESLLKGRLRRRIERGCALERAVVLGGKADVERFLGGLSEEARGEFEVVSRLGLNGADLEQLPEILARESIGRVIIAADHASFQRVEEAILDCETEGVEVWLVADFIQTSIARPRLDMLGDHPMLVFQSTPAISWSLLIKGIIDRILALVLILLTSPLWLIAAVGIRWTAPGGQVMFRQRRGGLHGRPFSMLKFRTMVPDAEAKRGELEFANEMEGPVFKLERDPRVTPFGQWLRKTSIDELPQLINVLRGEMSLVGPRPLPVDEVARISKRAQRRRLSVKPGLTCLWQVGGRSRIVSFEEWVELDLRYIDNWSLWLDLKILAMTVPAVLLRSGAR